MADRQPGVCVVGAGYWGKNLVRNFAGLGALRAVCDADAGRLDVAGGAGGGPRLFRDYEEALGCGDVEAVVLATPARDHFRMAEAALRRGKDVFVEKPIALRYHDGAQLVALARRQGRVLMVGHLLEYHPAVLRLCELVDRGELGTIQYIYSTRLNFGKIRCEENILWSFAPHDLAVILRLLGDYPLEVTATGGAYLQPNVADVTITGLLFDRGVRAHIFVSWLHPYKEQRLVVVGSQRMAVFDDVEPKNKLVLFDQHVEWVDGQPVPRRHGGTPVDVGAEEPLRLECQHFLDCVRTRQAPRTDGASALRVLRVLQASQHSLQTNGQPIQLVEARNLEVMQV